MAKKKPYELAYQDYKDGMSYADMAKKYKVSLATVKSWYARHWKRMREQDAKSIEDADSLLDGTPEQSIRLDSARPNAIIETVSSNQMEMFRSGELYQYSADNLPEIELKQARFVKEFCIDLNGRQAAIRAGYPISNVDHTASRLRNDPKVASHIEAALAAADRRTGMNIERARKELAKVALANPAKVVANDGSILDNASEDDLAAIQSIKVKCVGVDKGTGEPMYEREVRFHDKTKAIELYAKMGQWLVERKEVNVTTKIEEMTDEDRKKRIAELQKQLAIDADFVRVE